MPIPNPKGLWRGMFSSHRSDPFALAHERFYVSRCGDAVDVELAGADHPIDVDEAIVRAMGGQLLGGHLVAVAHAG